MTKDPSKQEGTNVCWDSRFFNPFLNFNQLPAAKKGFKKRAFLQTLDPSYFVRALGVLLIIRSCMLGTYLLLMYF